MRMTSMRVVHGGDEGNRTSHFFVGRTLIYFFRLIQADLTEITSLGFFRPASSILRLKKYGLIRDKVYTLMIRVKLERADCFLLKHLNNY